MEQAANINCEFVMKDGAKICARVEEGDGKPPVVLIHGWGFCHLMWDTQITHLKGQGHPVVAIDLRGFGNSDESKPGYSYQTWANDIGEVMTQLRMGDDVTLVGYSMGGAIAMYYVANDISPSVKKLALIAAAGPCMHLGPCPYGLTYDEFETAINLISKIPLPERFIISYESLRAFVWFLDKAFGPRSPPTRSWHYRWLYKMFKSASKSALIRGLEEMRDQNMETNLQNIEIPTMILHGRWDKLVNPRLAIMQKSLIKSKEKELICCEHSGHGLFFQQADGLNKKLEAFVR